MDFPRKKKLCDYVNFTPKDETCYSTYRSALYNFYHTCPGYSNYLISKAVNIIVSEEKSFEDEPSANRLWLLMALAVSIPYIY